MKYIVFLIPVLLLTTLAKTVFGEDEVSSTLKDQKEVTVTIYNKQLALVKDLRKIKLDNGFNRLALREVSAKIRPETALLRSVNYPEGFRLIEQNFDFDLLTPQKLLEKYVGKKVQVVRTHPTTGEERIEEAEVLSVNQGVVLKVGNRIESGYPGRIIYDEVPENLRDRPTLVISLESGTAKEQDLQLSYLTGGLSWKADYVAELDASERFMELAGWVTLSNNSGASYTNAKLQLVAGDVNRVKNARRAQSRNKVAAAEVLSSVESEMVEEELFEYHLYTLQRPTTILDKQSKQVSLLSASKIPVSKKFLLQGQDHYYRRSYKQIGQKLKIDVFVEFENEEVSNLGLPLPKGIVRVYKNDRSGNAQFIGEDRIDHTPRKERVKLKLGKAFDVTANRKQTYFKKAVAIGKYNQAYTAGFEISLKNTKSEEVEVVVREPIPGDWNIRKESHEHKKITSGTAEWKIRIPAAGKTTLSYEILVRY